MYTNGSSLDVRAHTQAVACSQVAEAVAKASAQADKRIKAVLEQKAQQIVSNLDLSKALALDLPPEEAVAGVMQEAQEKLKVRIH